MRRIHVASLVLTASALLAARANASIWTGAGADGNWTTPQNWDTVPNPADSLTFHGTTQTTNTNDFANATAFTDITFNVPAGQPAFNISGNSITLLGNLTKTGNGSATLATPITLATTPIANVSDSGTLTLSGLISGTNGLYKTGTGILSLTNISNNFSGTVTISQGTLSIATFSCLGAAATTSGLLILDGGTLRASSSDANTPLTLTQNGGTLSAFGSAVRFGNSTLIGPFPVLLFSGTGARTLTLTTPSSTSNSGTINYLIADAAPDSPTSLVKNGNGTWQVVASNTYTGGTTVTQGTLNATHADSLGTGNVSIDAAAVNLNSGLQFPGTVTNNFFLNHAGALGGGDGVIFTGNITLTGDGIVAGNCTINSKITGPGNLSLSGPFVGSLKLNNAFNDYTGTTFLNGTIKLLTSEVLPNGAAAGNVAFRNILNPGFDLDLNGQTETLNGLTTHDSTVLGGTNDIIRNSSSASANLILGDNNADSTLARGIQFINNGTTGAINLSKIGSGVLNLDTRSANLPAKGTITVNAGKLVFTQNSLAITPGTVAYFAHNSIDLAPRTLTSTGEIDLTHATSTLTTNVNFFNNILLNSGVTLDEVLSFTNTSSPLLSTTNLTLSQNLTLNLDPASTLPIGRYLLINYSTLTDNSTNFTGWSIANLPANRNASFALGSPQPGDSKGLYLLITAPEPASLTLLTLAGPLLLQCKRPRRTASS